MAPLRRLFVGGLLVLAVGGPVSADSAAVTSLLKRVDVIGYLDRPMPPGFDGRTVDERPVSLGALQGKVVLVNFWASWCLECRPEMPRLERLHREFALQGLAVLGVNARQDREAVQRYARELSLTFPLVLDPNGKINTAYGVIGLPTTFVIGRDGRAIGLAVGPREWTATPMRELIKALLAEPGRHPQ